MLCTSVFGVTKERLHSLGLYFAHYMRSLLHHRQPLLQKVLAGSCALLNCCVCLTCRPRVHHLPAACASLVGRVCIACRPRVHLAGRVCITCRPRVHHLPSACASRVCITCRPQERAGDCLWSVRDGAAVGGGYRDGGVRDHHGNQVLGHSGSSYPDRDQATPGQSQCGRT
jgi:hypothetical protein